MGITMPRAQAVIALAITGKQTVNQWRTIQLNMLKPGDLAILKTTEEVVFVLAIEPLTTQKWPGLSNTEVVLRRPVQTAEKGIYHSVERFQLDEIESTEEKHRRTAREYASFKRIAKEESKAMDEQTHVSEEDLVN